MQILRYVILSYLRYCLKYTPLQTALKALPNIYSIRERQETTEIRTQILYSLS